LPPEDNRLLYGQHQIKLGDAQPQIPIVEAGHRIIEEADAIKARPAKDHAATGDKILPQQLPEEIALQTSGGMKATRGRGMLVYQQRLPVDHPGFRVSFECRNLHIKRAGYA
jgi:hypothetical protein